MEQWYVLKTVQGREEKAAALLKQNITPTLWGQCRVLKKVKVFRSGGALHFPEEVLFPGYVFIRTGCPESLEKELKRSGDFPQFPSIAPVEPADLAFLKDVCGETLERPMGVTRLTLDGENQIIRAEGILSGYLDQIIKLNLHRRFALVETALFNRIQTVLFGIALEQDGPVCSGGRNGRGLCGQNGWKGERAR